jgi:hypothetical protein
MSEPRLTQTILKRLIKYNPKTGVFVWLPRPGNQRWNTRYAGKVAGFDWSPNDSVTYRSIRIFDWPFLGHRLAVLYMTGSWPKDRVDHRDLNGTNNRWRNLREANASQNSANTRRLSARNKTGYRGVSICPRSNKFRANIKLNGRQTHLGHFTTAKAAYAAYCAAAREKSGEFARLP